MSANSNTLTLTLEVDDKGSIKVKQFAGGIDAAGKQVEGAAKGMGLSLGNLEGIITKVAAAFALWKVADFVRDSTMAAARFETLGVVVERLGKNTAYTTDELKGYETGLRATGIAGIEARVVIAQMIQSNLDLSKSTDLARVAQDAAVIANLNSSETLERMMHAIQSNSVEIVRTIGLQVSFEDATKRMAARLGKTVEQLTDSEKVQARLNAVIAAGVNISGAYESSMNTAGKQINSFKRYVQDFEVEFGKAFNPALTQIVFGASEALKVLTETVKDPQFQSDLTKMSLDISKGLVDGMKWLVENRENVKGFFTGIAGGLSAIVSVMAKLPPEAWGALLGYKVGGVYGAAAGAALGVGYRIHSNIPTEQEALEIARKQLRQENVEGAVNWETGNIAAAEITIEQFMENLKRSAELRDRIDAMMNTYPPMDPEKAWKYRASGRSGANSGFGPDPGPDPLSKETQAAIKKFWDDYDKAMGDVFGAERRKLDEQLKEYAKHVQDKAALNRWYFEEKRKIDIKEYADTASTREMGTWKVGKDGDYLDRPEYVGEWGVESQRAKSYAQDIQAKQKIQEDFEANNRELWKKSVTYGEESFDEMTQLSVRTAEAMQQNFSNLFFDVMQGKFKSWRDYVTAVFDSIQRAFADMAGQMAAQSIFGKDLQGGGLLSSGLGMLGSLFGGASGMGTNETFSGGGTMGGYMALVKHAGGMAEAPGPMRHMPAWMIASAPRFHNGLAPDEIPAVLQRGETVLPRGVPASVSISVPINIAAGTGEVSGRLQGRLRGEMEETARRVLREEMR